MNDRVSCDEISTAMDRIQEKLELRIPNRLHRIVAAHTGLHPTTVLRYHRREIEKADVRVLEYLLGLERRIDGGEAQLGEDETRILFSESDASQGPCQGSIYEVQFWMDRVVSLLESPGPYIVYRYVADEMGLHPTTVMRYHTGDLGTVPHEMIQVLRELERKLDAGEAVTFARGEGDGERVVPRRCILTLLDQIRSMRVLPEGPGLESTLERMLQLRRGTFRRIRSPEAWPFVRYDLMRTLMNLKESFSYDPARTYEVGEMLHHHELGTGRVTAKRHKSRMVVAFEDGTERCLCENVPYDPRWSHQLD
jgi:hypothetical protein